MTHFTGYAFALLYCVLGVWKGATITVHRRLVRNPLDECWEGNYLMELVLKGKINAYEKSRQAGFIKE